ncbi:hypothetical protein NDU88_007437 [Pleurodeles waltl]|uniref:Uncharacterized protein n=1 Tax=Pleurodeles waltl TaxID=8319 RepID=A0AAV7N284_PLEWA|nr:hypothetical protein NDU88_007437 [Pleurodeles waltl]
MSKGCTQQQRRMTLGCREGYPSFQKEAKDAQDGARSSVSSRGLSQMDLDINVIESYSMPYLRKLCRERGLKIPEGYLEFEYLIAHKAWEEARRMQAAPQEESKEDYFTTAENTKHRLYLTLESGTHEGDGHEKEEGN